MQFSKILVSDEHNFGCDELNMVSSTLKKLESLSLLTHILQALNIVQQTNILVSDEHSMVYSSQTKQESLSHYQI